MNTQTKRPTANNQLKFIIIFFDQFWGAEKDASRLDSTLFEDLNRYCWQQNNSGDLNSQTCNTDGQIYTLTVLNGSEPTWLPQTDQNLNQRKMNETNDGQAPASALDFDSLLNTFPGYVKTEYTYDDSGFSTDNKDDMILTNGNAQSQQQNQQQTNQQNTQTLPSIQAIPVTNNANINNNINAAFHNNNNNDWQMADHNITVDNGNVC